MREGTDEGVPIVYAGKFRGDFKLVTNAPASRIVFLGII